MTEGSGLDGLTYARLAQDFHFIGLDAYLIQRILPSAVVHYGLKLFGITPAAEYVIKAFQYYNLVLLLLSVFVWGAISNSLELGSRARWIGFLALFVNFANLKMVFYYAVLTDTTAFALSLLIMWAFLRRRVLLLGLLILASSLTWPLLTYLAVPLLLYQKPIKNHNNTNLGRVLATGLILVYVTMLFFYFVVFGRDVPKVFAQPILPLVPVSILVCTVYLYFSITRLLEGLSVSSITTLNLYGGSLAAGLVLILVLFIYTQASLAHPAFALKNTLANVTALSIVRPFGFIISHFIYFGPIVC